MYLLMLAYRSESILVWLFIIVMFVFEGDPLMESKLVILVILFGLFTLSIMLVELLMAVFLFMMLISLILSFALMLALSADIFLLIGEF